MKKLANRLSLVFFVLGLVLLGFLVRKVGVPAIVGTFRAAGWQIAWVMVLPISWYFLQSLAWYRILKDDDHAASLWDVFLAKITGEAVNTITPVSIAGGDPYRVYLLQKKASKTASTSSVVVDRTVHTIAVFLLLVLGLTLAWLELPLPESWNLALPTALAVFLIFLAVLVRAQKRGAFSGLSRVLQRLGVAKSRLKNVDGKLATLDAHVGAFYGKHKLHFFEILGLHFLSRLLGAVEIWIIARIMHLPVTFDQSVLLASFTILVNMAFVFIPGSMGVMEGGYGAVFYLMQLDPAHGVAIQLVRRLRTFFWIFLGLLAMLAYRTETPEPDTMR